MVTPDKNIDLYPLTMVKKTIADFQMLQKKDAVLVGVSGGPDSMALLDLLIRLRSEFAVTIAVAHLNHGIRGKDADDDADFVRKVAAGLGVQCHIERVNAPAYRQQHHLSLEQAARRLRYSFFSRIAESHHYNRIALGHHKDDNAEMVLMALLRGSGPLGLSGIPPVRSGNIIRPLIRLTKDDIYAYLEARGIRYVVDRSNEETDYLRNRVRHQLMPLLKKEYNPGITDILNRTADILRCEDDWLKTSTMPALADCMVTSGKYKQILSLSRVKQYHRAIQRRVLRMALGHVKGSLKRISFDHVEAVLNLMDGNSSQKRLDFPERVMVLIHDDQIEISKEKTALRKIPKIQTKMIPHHFSYDIKGPGKIQIKETGLCLHFSVLDVKMIGDVRNAGQQKAFFDIEKLKFPLELRPCLPGDRFTPLGMKGTKTVEKFLKDRRVPKQERCNNCVLLSEDNIIWVVGRQIDDAFRVTPFTEKALAVTMQLPKTRPCISDENDY